MSRSTRSRDPARTMNTPNLNNPELKLPVFPGSSLLSIGFTVPLESKNCYREICEEQQYRLRFPAVDEARMMRKIDMRVMPVLSVMYLLTYFDR